MGLFLLIFGLFQTNIKIFYKKLMWKNVHPVWRDGIRTLDLQIESLIPLPLDQGSRPISLLLFPKPDLNLVTRQPVFLLRQNDKLNESRNIDFKALLIDCIPLNLACSKTSLMPGWDQYYKTILP